MGRRERRDQLDPSMAVRIPDLEFGLKLLKHLETTTKVNDKTGQQLLVCEMDVVEVLVIGQREAMPMKLHEVQVTTCERRSTGDGSGSGTDDATRYLPAARALLGILGGVMLKEVATDGLADVLQGLGLEASNEIGHELVPEVADETCPAARKSGVQQRITTTTVTSKECPRLGN